MSTRPADTLLTRRAIELLAAGPADAAALIAHVCGLSGVPGVIAEQMSAAIFADRPEFGHDANGRWCLTDLPPGVGNLYTEGPAPISILGSDPALASLSYVVVDVETTGSCPWAGDRITEVAAIVVHEGAIGERFETLVNPQRPIPALITALTNISWDMVKDAPRFGDVCERLLDVLAGRIFVAHNAEFDWRFLASEIERATGQQLAGRRLCTVRLARRLLPQLRSRRLDAVADYYGIHISERHRAGGDATATASILLRLLAEARDRECESWEDLQRLLRRPRRRSRPRRSRAMPGPVDRDTTA